MGVADYYKRQLKTIRVPHFKSTDLNRIQVTTLSCCNIQVIQRYCTMLATATGNCDATNATYNANKYYVVAWTVYLESSMFPRNASDFVRSLLYATFACWIRIGTVLKFDQFLPIKLLLNQAQTCFLVNVRMWKWFIFALWFCEALGSLQIDIASLRTNSSCDRYCSALGDIGIQVLALDCNVHEHVWID